MSPPPATHNLLASAAGRREVKAARRDVLLQCDKCKCHSTGRINGFGRVARVNIPARPVRGRWQHRECGGALVAFDIGGH